MDPSESPPEAPPTGASPMPPPYPPFPTYLYPPPQQNSSNLALMIVIVLVVITAISVLIPAILYLMVSGLISGGPPPPSPIVTFTAASVQGDTLSFDVASASEPRAASAYRLTLFVNGTSGSPQTLAPSFTLTVGGDPYQITYNDTGGAGTLSAGDEFRVRHSSGFAPSGSYEFFFLSNDAVVGTVRWP